MLRSIKLVLVLSFVFVKPTILFASGELDREGGPDEFGYSFYDQEEENGPEFNWVDIRNFGLEIEAQTDNDYLGPFELNDDFIFPFYGEECTEFYLSTNGWISFSPDQDSAPENQDIADGNDPANLIALFWDDLNPSLGGTIYYAFHENTIIIQLQNVPSQDGNGDITAEIILFDNGDIVLQYQEITMTNNSCTVGIEGSGAGLQYCYNEENLAPQDGYAVGFTLNENIEWPPPTATVEGIVTDECRDQPVAGVHVYIGNRNGITDEDGNYLIEGVETDLVELIIVEDGYFDETIVLDLMPGMNTVDVEIRPEPYINADPFTLIFELEMYEEDSDILSLENQDPCEQEYDFELRVTHQNVEYGAPYLVLHTTLIDQSILRALSELEVDATYMNTQNWSEINLDPYSSIILAMDGGTPEEEDWSHLLDWCSAGGKLMLFGGSSTQSMYDAMMRMCHHTDERGFITSSAPHMNLENEEPPLNANLVEGYNFINTAATYYMIRFDDEEMDIASRNGDGVPNIISKNYGSGTFLAFIQTPYSGYWTNQDDFDQLKTIVQNFLNFQGYFWLHIDPLSGTIGFDELIDIEVDVFTWSLLAPAQYSAIVDVLVEVENEIRVVGSTWIDLNVINYGTIEGFVRDSETEEGLEHAGVELWVSVEEDLLFRTVFTDDTGFYQVGLPTGEYEVVAGADGYYSSEIVEQDVFDGETYTIDFELDHEFPPELSIDPELLEFELALNEIVTETVTLVNNGGRDAHWYADVLITDEEFQDLQRDRRQKIESAVQNLINECEKSTDKQHRNYDTPPSEYAFTIFYDENPANRKTVNELDSPPHVLIVAADELDAILDVIDKLIEQNVFSSVTYMDAWIRAPRLQELELFDVVLTWTNLEYGQPASLGDRLADYIDDGGAVICALPGNSGVHLEGRFNEEDYWCIPPGEIIEGPQESLGFIHYPDYLLMHGVEEFDGGDSSFRPSTTELHPDAHLIAEWSDGQPLVAIRELENGSRRVDLGYYPPSSDVNEGNWNADTDGARILANAIVYASMNSTGWLSIEPASGVLGVDDAVDLQVTATLSPNQPAYEALVNFHVIEPDTLEPVSLWSSVVPQAPLPGFQTIPLQGNYFELVSFHIHPQPNELNAEELFSDLEHLVIAYQNDGSIYIPDQINTIGEISLNQGYRLFANEDDELTIAGDYGIYEHEIVYSALPDQWNWVGYQYSYEVPVETALASIEEHIQIVMDDDGNFWIPDLANTLINMEPGEGYFLFVDEAVRFYYEQDIQVVLNNDDQEFTHVVSGGPIPTGLPQLFLVRLSDDLNSGNPSTIELWDGSLLVGKAVVDQDVDIVPVIAWGGDDEVGLVGFTEGHDVTVKVLNESGTLVGIYPTPGIGTQNNHSSNNGNVTFNFLGKDPYTALTVEKIAIPDRFEVGNAYPNPFNPTFAISLSLPAEGNVQFELMNILGQTVYSVDMYLFAGRHVHNVDISKGSSGCGSGVYFLQVTSKGEMHRQKVVLIR
ncbi:carboxypeptidase regulatory-like domain-containing protein [bacterium]|nr:carboxypeptidase regulatory-like domain-containing protein [bacterium]